MSYLQQPHTAGCLPPPIPAAAPHCRLPPPHACSSPTLPVAFPPPIPAAAQLAPSAPPACRGAAFQSARCVPPRRAVLAALPRRIVPAECGL
eukprot:363318-Chlamydomonas_euryale.AAC.10